MRLTINIPDDIHRSLKIKAAREGATMRALLLQGIDDYLKSKGITVTAEGRVDADIQQPERVEASRHVTDMDRGLKAEGL